MNNNMRNYINMSKQKAVRSEAMGLLAGGIAYNINKILASILGNIEMSQIYAKDENQLMSRLKKAEKAVARAKDLTQQLLDLSNGNPAKKSQAAVESFQNEQDAPQKAGCQGRVLLMDDEDIVLESTGDLLLEIGYTVEMAKNGAEVIKLYKEALESGKPFDVVVLDLEVPDGKGGEDTLQELFKLDPDVKAVISSGYTTDPVITKHKEYGFVSALSKPFRIKELSAALKTALANHSRA